MQVSVRYSKRYYYFCGKQADRALNAKPLFSRNSAEPKQQLLASSGSHRCSTIRCTTKSFSFLCSFLLAQLSLTSSLHHPTTITTTCHLSSNKQSNALVVRSSCKSTHPRLYDWFVIAKIVKKDSSIDLIICKYLLET